MEYSSDPGGLHFLPTRFLSPLEVDQYIQPVLPDLGVWLCEKSNVTLRRSDRHNNFSVFNDSDLGANPVFHFVDLHQEFGPLETDPESMHFNKMFRAAMNSLASTVSYLTDTITSHENEDRSTKATRTSDIPIVQTYLVEEQISGQARSSLGGSPGRGRWTSDSRIGQAADLTIIAPALGGGPSDISMTAQVDDPPYFAEQTGYIVPIGTTSYPRIKPPDQPQDNERQIPSPAVQEGTRANLGDMQETNDATEDQDYRVLPSQTTIIASNIILAAAPAGSPKQGETTPPESVSSVGHNVNAVGQDQYGVADRPLNPGRLITIDNGPSKEIFRLQTSSDKIFFASELNRPSPQPLITSGPAFKFNKQILSPNDQGQYQLDGHTLVPGGPAVTVGPSGKEHVMALQTYNGHPALVVDSSQTILPVQLTLEPAITVDRQKFTANDGGRHIIDDHTFNPGGPPFIIGLGSSTHLVDLPDLGRNPALAIASATSLVQKPTSMPAITFNGQEFDLDDKGELFAGSQKIMPNGGPVTVRSGESTHLVELKSSGTNTALVVDGSSTRLPMLGTTAAAITFRGQTFNTNDHAQYTVNDETLTPGQAPRLIGSGHATHLVGMITSGTDTVLVVDSSSTTLSQLSTLKAAKPAITLNGQILSTDAQGQYIFGSKTLTPGGAPVTIPGSSTHVIGLQTAGGKTALVVDSSSTTLAEVPSPTDAPAITFEDHTFTVDSQGRYVIDDKTLTPGGVVSIFGTPISLAPDGNEIVIGTSTEAVVKSTDSTGQSRIAPSQTRARPSKSAAVGRKIIPICNWTMWFAAWFLWAMGGYIGKG